MRSITRRRGARARLAGLLAAAVLAGGALVATAGTAGATGAEFPQCPAFGHETGCAELITVGATGTASTQVDTSQPAYDLQEDVLVGVLNNSGAYVTSIALSGNDVLGFDGDGICAGAEGEPPNCPFGTTGYEGPGTSFTVTNPSAGTVNFTGAGLAPGASAYFSLEAIAQGGAVTLASALTGHAASIAAVEGTAFSGMVGTFTDADLAAPASAFSATITWGDGTTTAGTVTGSAGSFAVTGSHLYAEEGSHPVGVTVTETALPVNSVTIASSAVVADADLSGAATTFNVATGVSTGSISVATFTDANPTAPLSDFSATVNWGDGTTTAGTVTGPVSGTFAVSGSHTYATHGTYPVTVAVKDVGGASLTVVGAATVSDAIASCPAGKTCSSTATVPNQMATQVSGQSSTTGEIFVNVGLDTVSCGDPFNHAPEVTTVTETNYTSASGKLIVLTIDKAALAKFKNPSVLNFRVCYSSPTPFTDIYGKTVTTGLLPLCLTNRLHYPCVWLAFKDLHGNVEEIFSVPSGDPKFW